MIALGSFIWLLFDARCKFSKSFGPDEDEWGVGQILALVLFINPFVDFFFSVWQVNSEYVAPLKHSMRVRVSW